MVDLARLPLDIKIDLLLAIHYYGWKKVENSDDLARKDEVPYFSGHDVFTHPPVEKVFFPAAFFRVYNQLSKAQQQTPSAYRFLRNDLPAFSSDVRVAMPFMESMFDGHVITREVASKLTVVALWRGTTAIEPAYAETTAQAIALAALTAKRVSIASPL